MVIGDDNVGGLVGRTDGVPITNSYARGNVTGKFFGNPANEVGNYYIGGLVGYAFGATKKTTTNAIELSNLPSNAKVEVYNSQGKRIYSTHSENSEILRIGVQTGIYIVKVGTQTMRVAVR